MSGLSVSGTIMMPIIKNEREKRKSKKATDERNQLIAQARMGNEEAIESLLDTKRAAVRDDFFDQYSTLDTADERNELNQLEDEVLELSYLAENADVTIDITIQAEDIAKVNAALQESICAFTYLGKNSSSGK